MKLRRTLLAVMAVLCVMAMLLTACGNQPAGGDNGNTGNNPPAGNTGNDNNPPAGNTGSDNNSPAGGDAEPVTLTYWYWADNDTYAAKMEEIIADFNATNEYGITVVGEQQNWDGGGYSTTLQTACLGGGGPDMATFKLTATPTFVENDLLYDLTGMVAAWDGSGDISDNLWNTMKYASNTDNIYVMPWNIQVLYVYYRPSYFEAAGASVPTNYTEFLDAIKTISEANLTNDAGEKVYGFGMRGNSGGQEPWGSFIYANGGSFEDLASAGAVAGMQDFIDLYTNGYVPANSTEVGFAEMKADFLGGRTAMMVHHCASSLEMMETFGDDVGAFIFPASDKGQWTSLGDTENVVMSSTKNPEAAFEFMKYMAAGKGEEMWCEATGNVPVSERVQAMDFVQSNPFLQISIGGIDVAGILPCNPTTSEFISAWPNIIAQGLEGTKTAEQVCGELQALLWP